MRKKLISILLFAILFCCSGCRTEQSGQPAVSDSVLITEDKMENGNNNEVKSNEKDNSDNTAYVIDEKEPLNTDYHIRNEATKITHLESLFDKLNQIS